MFASRNKKLKKQSGFSLIEIMLASAISLLLLSILFTLYLSVHRSFLVQNMLYRIQDNGKLAASMLKTEINKAGNIGCPRLMSDFPIIYFLPYTITAQNKLMGTEDSLTVRYAEEPHAELLRSMQKPDIFYVNNHAHFSANDILIISDCKNAEIFKVEKVDNYHELQRIKTSLPLHFSFAKWAEVSRLAIYKYYVAKTKHPEEGALYSLFVEDIFHRKTELIGGINAMHIKYSVLREGKIIDLSASEILDWSKIVGVAIELKLISGFLTKTWYTYAAVN